MQQTPSVPIRTFCPKQISSRLSGKPLTVQRFPHTAPRSHNDCQLRVSLPSRGHRVEALLVVNGGLVASRRAEAKGVSSILSSHSGPHH